MVGQLQGCMFLHPKQHGIGAELLHFVVSPLFSEGSPAVTRQEEPSRNIIFDSRPWGHSQIIVGLPAQFRLRRRRHRLSPLDVTIGYFTHLLLLNDDDKIKERRNRQILMMAMKVEIRIERNENNEKSSNSSRKTICGSRKRRSGTITSHIPTMLEIQCW